MSKDRPREEPMPLPPEQTEQHGLECRRCGCRHFRVLHARRVMGGRILRRRECRHCGRGMTTYEEEP